MPARPPIDAAPGLLLDPADDVAVVLADVATGQPVGAGTARVVALVDIPRGHKVALRAIGVDEPVRKYGQVIGFATRPIAPGDHVHVQNLEFRTFDRPATSGTALRGAVVAPGSATFEGYVRSDGRVGTRNYLGILTTVNCSATVARMIARQVEDSGLLRDHPNIDGIVPLTHTSGCCVGGGDGFEYLKRTLAGYARHPNFGAVLVLGLGCEGNQVDQLVDRFEIPDGRPLDAMTIQAQGGTTSTVADGIAAIERMLPRVAAARREAVPASELIVAMECGGSDAYSGLTANPAVGAAGDLVAAHGGTFVFGETPEIYGAEHLLMARAVDPGVAAKLRERIDWWERYVGDNGGTMDNNPAPGNKEGGITTILEKSLGAIAKGGLSDLSAVYEYGEPITAKGMVFMDTPGFDPVSVTGMVAGGATVACFTTGRGSVFGCKPVPSIKVATNTPMFERLQGDMDIDAGRILSAGVPVEELGREVFEAILAVASGRRTKSEELGFGTEEFNPWLIGAVM